MMKKYLKISNFILRLSEHKLINEQDLVHSYNIFIENEEYEKCSIINELIKIKKFDNKSTSFFNLYTKIKDGKEKFRIILENLNELKEINEENLDLVNRNEKLLKDIGEEENLFWKILEEWEKLYILQKDLK